MDLPVCIAYLVLCFDVCAPLQEEGDHIHIALPGRIVEGCRPILQQQQRDRDRSGQGKKGKKQKDSSGLLRYGAAGDRSG
jgi:hypothetical protein